MMVVLAQAAGFAREMRIGSLEMTAALAVVAILAARPRVRAAAEIGSLTPVLLGLDVFERGVRCTTQARPPCVVGRAKECGVVLQDPEVSRRHARFSSHDGIVYVEDLDSRNGTFLNGHRVSEAIEVRAGDEVDVGTTRMIVTEVSPQ